MQSFTPEPGERLGGKIQLERLLARGGQGSVWVARHLTLDLPVAVKFMTATSLDAPQARARFEREAKASARLPSPHVVRVLDYGFEETTPYIVMECLTGEDLRARLAREGRLSVQATASMVSQVAKGLKLAHDAGVIHRDLKPSNLFLAKVGDEEVVKILDFGVAKDTMARLVDDGLGGRRSGTTEVIGKLVADRTTTGLLLGSPGYMSPEQISGSSVDHRSDLWSLGVVAFVALTGHPPFAPTNVGELLWSICSEEPLRASSLVPELGPEIDAFFARALCRSPDGRFQSARDLAEALARIGANAPSAAFRPTMRAPDDGAAAAETASIQVIDVSAGAQRPIDRKEAGATPSGQRVGGRQLGRGARWGVASLCVVGGGWWGVHAMAQSYGSNSSTVVAAEAPALGSSASASASAAASASVSVTHSAPAPIASAPPPAPRASAAPSAAALAAKPAPKRNLGAAPKPRPTAQEPAVNPKFGLPVGP